MGLALGGIAAFSLVSAGAASIAGPKYGAIALLAGVVPASAAMLLIATMRANTAATANRPRDTTPSGSSASAAVGALHRRARLRETAVAVVEGLLGEPGGRADGSRRSRRSARSAELGSPIEEATPSGTAPFASRAACCAATPL